MREFIEEQLRRTAINGTLMSLKPSIKVKEEMANSNPSAAADFIDRAKPLKWGLVNCSSGFAAAGLKLNLLQIHCSVFR